MKPGKYGYQLSANGKALLRVPAEQEVIALTRELNAGGMRFVDVADELNRRGLRTRTGREWTAGSALRILGLY